VSREETLQPTIDFIRELDKLKGVERKTRPLGLARFENSAEHSWQLAVLAMALSRYAEGAIRLDRVVSMLLLHDIGEIDTGDTIAYAMEGMEQRKIAEEAAVKRICAILPDDLGNLFESLWHEFEAEETPEAKFAHAMDRSIPIILNLANNGQSWRENGISYEQVIKRNGPAVQAGCPALWAYLQRRLDEARTNGWFGF
jgi:putative hydrolases of HD superfamily